MHWRPEVPSRARTRGTARASPGRQGPTPGRGLVGRRGVDERRAGGVRPARGPAVGVGRDSRTADSRRGDRQGLAVEGENDASKVAVVVVGEPDPGSGDRPRVVIHRFQHVLHLPEVPLVLYQGLIDGSTSGRRAVRGCSRSWTYSSAVGGNHAWSILLATAAAIGLFEWRIKGENKSLMRFSALGTSALRVVPGGHRDDGLARGALLCGDVRNRPDGPSLGRGAGREHRAATDGIEQARVKKDWDTMQAQAEQASAHRTPDTPDRPSIPWWVGAHHHAGGIARPCAGDDREHPGGAESDSRKGRESAEHDPPGVARILWASA